MLFDLIIQNVIDNHSGWSVSMCERSYRYSLGYLCKTSSRSYAIRWVVSVKVNADSLAHDVELLHDVLDELEYFYNSVVVDNVLNIAAKYSQDVIIVD